MIKPQNSQKADQEDEEIAKEEANNKMEEELRAREIEIEPFQNLTVKEKESEERITTENA